MSRLHLRYALIIATVGVLVAFVISLTPAFALSFKPLLIMLALMLLMVALHCYSLTLAPTEAPAVTPPAPGVEKPAILILGPYAAKWFSQNNPNENARFSGHAAWLLIAEPKELRSRLHDISHHAPGTPMMAFFPFLPDGHESSTLIIENLTRWQSEFSALVEYLTLPCVLGIYARLSNERRSHTPQNATWIGEFDFNQQQAVSYTRAIDKLKRQISQRMNVTAHDAQRAVMGRHLINWLHESGLEQALTNLFTQAPLQLNNVMLCDYGNGFSRHGAWSSWLEQKYALLPGLGSTLTLPPFPPVQLPVSAAQAVNAPLPVVVPRRLPAVFWSTGLVLLLLSIHMLNTSWLVRQQQLQFHQQMRQLATLKDLSLQTLQHRITKMTQVQQAWSQCVAIPALRYWGFSPCRRFVGEMEKRVTALRELPTISTRGPIALFESGSASLLPGATPLLEKIEALVKTYPQRNIVIIGHSDNTGNDNINLVLSAQRAKAVQDWLIQHNVDASRLETRAVGASEPVASNDSPLGRQQNRRVEIVVLPFPHIEKEFTKL